MYCVIIIFIIILYIFLFFIFKKVDCSDINIIYHNNPNVDILLKSYFKDLYNGNYNILLNIANTYHYGINNDLDKNLYKALEYYYMYLIIIQNKQDIVSKKNKLYILNKIKEITEIQTINLQTKINIPSINEYLLDNILDKSDIIATTTKVDNLIINDLNNYIIEDNNDVVDNNEDNNIINDNYINIIDENNIPIHRAILQDNQNIHDTYINNTIQNSINNIKTNINNDNNITIDNINNIIKDELNKQNFDDNKINNILKVLDRINMSNTKSIKNNMTSKDALELVFNRIYNKNNEDIKNTFISNLFIELNDCIENGNIVCQTGIFNRIMNSINLLDNEVNIKSYDFLNEEIMNKCIAIRNTIDDNIPNYSDELKNKIKLEMNKDYVNTKILTQGQLDDILNIWIDHI